MAIYLDAYHTYAGQAYKKKLDEIKFQLDLAKVNGLLNTNERFSNILELRDPTTLEIPVFPFPLTSKDTNRNDDFTVYVDLRAYSRKGDGAGDYVIKPTIEYTLDMNITYLTRLWLKEDPFTILSASPIPLIVFSTLISELVTRRYALNPMEQLKLTIYTGYYYYTLFSDNYGFSDNDQNRIISSLARNLRCATNDVIIVLNEIDFKLNGINDFCVNLPTIIPNVKLKDFNITTLYQIVNYCWFGPNAKQLIGVALEFPPAFISLVLAAYTDRSYKNTILAKSAEKKASRSAIETFHKSISNLIENN